MAETARVWVKTSVIEEVVYGKVKSSAKRRTLPDGLSSPNDDNGLCNWGWARAELIREESSKRGKSSQNAVIAADNKPVKVHIKDAESEHNLSTLEIPAKLAKEGVVMDNVWADGDSDDDDSDDGGGFREGPPDDLINLTHLHEPAVVYCLRKRYARDKIYTATGPILLALNPFKNCKSLYSDDVMRKYSNSGAESTRKGDDDVASDTLPPHVYAIADNSFRAMMRLFEESGGRRSPGEKGCDQSILVSGESGAGKTVTTKFIMQYLASLSQNTRGAKKEKPSPEGKTRTTEQQVLQSNPILESFGNARTIRNDNSSRFGKFIELEFTGSGSLVGASIETYLLEKVRLVTQTPGERNYHIFYELLVGMEEEELEKYHIGLDTTAEDFRMTNASGTFDRRDGVDDYDTFTDLRNAMDTMGFEQNEQEDIMAVTCAVLHLSNLDFLEISADESEIDRENPALEAVVSLMGFSADGLNQALCYFSIQAGKERHTRSLPKQKAEKGMEALIKATYGALFTHIVKKVNSSITVKEAASRRGGRGSNQKAKIGVLDIFGFESFKNNSFEQLCINYCNEALQQQFNLFVLKNEQEEYTREGIQWSFISFPENNDVLELIWKKGSGILNILDDQCRAPGTTDKTFATDMYQKCTGHPRFEADFRQVGARLFGVFHYAGSVEYNTEGFVEKNKDELPREATDLLKSSSSPFVQSLAEIISGGPAAGPSASAPAGAGARPAAGARGRRPVSRTGGGGASRSQARQTVGGQFSAQLTELRRKIDLTTPHYVRCLKPNDLLVPDCFDPVIISDQLRCAGVVEAVRVSRVGYPQRYTHSNFVKRYRVLALKELKKAGRGGRKNKSCEVLVDAIARKILNAENPGSGDKGSKSEPIDLVSVGLQVGKTKVFLRNHAYEAVEQMRSGKMDEAAVQMQAAARKFIALRDFKVVLQGLVRLQCAVRGKRAREEAHTLRLNTSATRIQSSTRRHVAKKHYLATLAIVQFLQRIQRGRNGRARYERLNRERKAKAIQTCWRRHCQLRKYQKIVQLAWNLNCLARHFFARKVLKGLKAQARDLSAIADERDELRVQVQNLKQELKLANKKAKEQANIAASAAASAEAEKEAQQHAAEVDQMRKEMEQLRSELEKAHNQAEEESKRAKDAEEKLATALKETTDDQKNMASTQIELEKSKEFASLNAKKVEEMQGTIEKLKADAVALKSSAASLEKKASEAEEKTAAKDLVVQRLQDQIDELTTELADPSSKAVSNGLGGAELEELEDLRFENEQMGCELLELKKKLDDANHAEVKPVQASDGTLPSEVDELRNELNEANKRLEESNSKLRKAMDELEGADQKQAGEVTTSQTSRRSFIERGEPPVSGEDSVEEIKYLRSEVMRLEEEIKNFDDDFDPNSPAHLQARYEELRRLSEAGMEKDREIEALRAEKRSLQDELKVAKSTNAAPAEGLTKGGLSEEVEADDTSSLGFGDVTTNDKDPFFTFGRRKSQIQNQTTSTTNEIEDESALKAVNEMLRNEVETLRKESEEAKAKAREEAEQAAKELEAFSEALRGVDEMRKAAETMSRELNRMKRRQRLRGERGDRNNCRDDASTISGGTEIFKEASKILDKSMGQANNVNHLWEKVKSSVSLNTVRETRRDDGA